MRSLKKFNEYNGWRTHCTLRLCFISEDGNHFWIDKLEKILRFKLLFQEFCGSFPSSFSNFSAFNMYTYFFHCNSSILRICFSSAKRIKTDSASFFSFFVAEIGWKCFLLFPPYSSVAHPSGRGYSRPSPTCPSVPCSFSGFSSPHFSFSRIETFHMMT